MSYIENLIIDKSLNGKEQSPEVVMKMKDQNFILMENEELSSHTGNPMNLVSVIDEE